MQLLKVSLKMMVAAAAAAFALIAPAGAGDAGSGSTPRAVFFSGVDGAPGSFYTYDGIVVAMNGDLSRDGFMVRLYGSYVQYDTDPGHGTGWQVDAMVGYKFSRGPVWGSIFVGVDSQDYNLSPDDPTSQVRGQETGFKVAGDLRTAYGSPFYAAIEGNYSTAFDSYWARARAGLYRDKLTWGPEFAVLGNIDFDAQRLGGFVTIHDIRVFRLRPFDLTFSVGHQWVNDNNNGTVGGVAGGEGTYGAITFVTLF
jgi:Cellulose biosynthesis protein BcsS